MTTVTELTKKILELKDLDGILQEASSAIQLQPASELMSSYGPLTDKLSKQNTLKTAQYLFDEYLSNTGSISPQESLLRSALNELADELVVENLRANVKCFGLLLENNDIKAAVDKAASETIDKLKSNLTYSQPAVLQLADVAAATTLTGVPFVGPALAGGIIGGPMAAISYGGGEAAAYFKGDIYGLYPGNPTGSSSSEKAYQGAMQMSKDVPKDYLKENTFLKSLSDKVSAQGDKDLLLSKPSSYGVGLAWYFFTKYMLKSVNSAITSAVPDDVKNIMAATAIKNKAKEPTVINPLTQNQLAYNFKFQQQITLRAMTAHKTKAEAIVATDSSTLKAFAEKIVKIHKISRDVFIGTIEQSIVDCFYEDLKNWNRELLPQSGPNKSLYSLSSSGENAGRVISLLIISYFYYKFHKQRNDLTYLDDVYLSAFEEQPGDNPIDRRSPVDKGTQLYGKFRSIKSFDTRVDDHAKWSSILTSSKAYITLLKTALLNDFSAAFKNGSDAKDISKGIKVYFAVVMAVSHNASLKAAMENKSGLGYLKSYATEIPDETINVLEAAGLLTQYYRDWKGSASQETKEKATAGGKLRYCKSIAGSSKAEKMMVYLFSTMAMSIINPTQLVCGVQNWSKTENYLKEVIKTINKYEMQMG
jgi:hypothetical protein